MIKAYENNDTSEFENREKQLYNINQIIEMYPLLSKHIITNGINDGNLKVTWIGNKRYFNLDDIESFIRNKQEKSNNIISDTIASWRSN